MQSFVVFSAWVMTGTRLGAILSLIPGLGGGNFSADALATLDGAIYSAAYSGRNGSEPINLGPDPDRKTPNPDWGTDETANFFNYGSLVAPNKEAIYLILEGGFNATTADDDFENRLSIWENQRSFSLYQLKRNSAGKWDLPSLLYTRTNEVELIPSRTYSWNQDGTPGGTILDYENGWYGIRNNFTRFVVNGITSGPGAIARLYQEWGAEGDYYGNVTVKYIDLLGDQDEIHTVNLYNKIIGSGDFAVRGQTGESPNSTYTSYYHQGLNSTSQYIFHIINQNTGTNILSEDSSEVLETRQVRKTLVFSEDLANADAFSFTGELELPDYYANDWNWTWLGNNGAQFMEFEGGALSILNINANDPDVYPSDSGKWYTPDIYLSYFDAAGQKVQSIDLDQRIEEGSEQIVSYGVFDQAYEDFELYSIAGQSYLLHKYEDPFLSGNGKFTYNLYGVYLGADDGTLKITGSAIKTIEFSYKQLGLSEKLITGLQSAVSAGGVQGTQFAGSSMWSMAVFDKSKSKVVPKAFNAYMKFQKKLYDKIASAVQGTANNDIYLIDNSAVNIVEQYGKGTKDKVIASCDYEIDETIEMLTLTGTDNYQGTGNGSNNLIVGNNGDNRLDGGDGNDKILGGNGDDTLIGGLGNDSLEGGNGSDTADYSDQAQAITVRLGTGIATGQGIGRDTLKSIENILSGSGNDEITCALSGGVVDAGGGDDLIIFGTLRDVVTGGEGIDTFRFASARAGARMGSANDRVFDHITDFNFGIDKIDLPGRGIPRHFGYLGSFDGPITDEKLSQLWANAEFATEPDTQGFSANTLGCFEVTENGSTRSFIALNDRAKAYGPGDMIIEMTGFTGAASFQGAISELFVQTFI